MKVIELFAGVGGFRVGLQNASPDYQVVWSNQFEPGKKKQVASEIYVKRFGSDNHTNTDISTVNVNDIPDHDLLVGGFPCQDYSVASTNAAGIEGKKGVLWWDINRIIETKRPKYILLENVDRLLKSPTKQRGRDFAIILACLSDMGYRVSWQTINAADYGFPQRRNRVFIFASLESMPSLFERAFPATLSNANKFFIEGDLVNITENFNASFGSGGLMLNRKVVTFDTKANYSGDKKVLADILEDIVPDEFFIDEKDIPQWEYLKGAKKIARTDKKTGYEYTYAEGAMSFPDNTDNPSRTIITGEGGKSPSRSKHVVRTNGKLRRLMPIELERLNGFPDNHTAGASDTQRAFLMGNALVTGIVTKLGIVLDELTKGK